ncbi:MAG: hypothetical protein V7L29_19070 [Nostoc sp.]|uniref:hypothetical protein n=1 Tax=Nostoc sp. TaxID=1180 RepID=UPI002FEFA76C
MVTTVNTDITVERVQAAVEAILNVLGEPATEQQKQAIEAFHSGDSATIKRLSLLNLTDNYLKCLGYLVSAPKLTPNTDTILAESARSAAEHAKDVVLATLGTELGNAFI